MGPPPSEEGCPQDDVPLPTLSSISFASGMSYAQIIVSPPLTLAPQRSEASEPYSSWVGLRPSLPTILRPSKVKGSQEWLSAINRLTSLDFREKQLVDEIAVGKVWPCSNLTCRPAG